MLTLKDLLKIEKIVDDKLDEKLEQKFNEKLRFLPTKEEFFTKMDEIMGELKAMREAFDLHTGQHDTQDNQEKRIRTIEKKFGIPSAI